MKKTLALLLSLALAGVAFASCNKVEEKPDAGDETKVEVSSEDTSKFTLQGIVDSIYAQKAPMFMFGTMPVDLEDEFSYKTYLGLEDPSVIKEAVFSEAMMGSQAYSLVIARVNDAKNAEKIAADMKAGIDTRKWICVEADDVKTATYGDLVCFIMIDSEYKDMLTAQEIVDAFSGVVTGKLPYEEGAEPNIPEMEVTEEEFPVDEDLPIEEELPAVEEEAPAVDLGLVSVNVIEGQCTLIDNAATNHQASNYALCFAAAYGTGRTTEDDAVVWEDVVFEEDVKQLAVKCGYNLTNKPDTSTEFWVYLDAIKGEPIAKVSVTNKVGEENYTASSQIVDQIYRFADVDIKAGTYDVIVVGKTENSGSVSQVNFLYEETDAETLKAALAA